MRNASECRLGARAVGGVTARYSAWGGTEDWRRSRRITAALPTAQRLRLARERLTELIPPPQLRQQGDP